ncbi:MAG: OadG family transporter subunit [Gammaproteobacteria bacterium]
MSSGELISEGFSLMLLGMGTVFVFLTILVIVTAIMSALVQKYGAAQPADLVSPGAAGQLDEATLLAVISAAIHAHRSRH